MRFLLFFTVLAYYVHALTCPSQYQLMEGKCIRPLDLWVRDTLDNLFPKSREECGKDGSHLPIIKNDEDNEAFRRIMHQLDEKDQHNYFIALDMICNNTTRHLEWIDGTSVNYSPKNSVDVNVDCVWTKKTAIARPLSSDWYLVETNELRNYYSLLCVIDDPASTTVAPTAKPTETPNVEQCGDYTLMDNPIVEKPCFKVFTETLSWNDAQRECAADFGSLITIKSAEENKFFWRTAITNGMVEGMHIGAHQSESDPSVWAWSDGEEAFSGKTYDNFVASFPIPGAVKTLICDDSKDVLEILEGTSGPHLIANLTTSVLTPIKFKTTASNVMRVNWKPSGSGKGRGFRIQYNEVDP